MARQGSPAMAAQTAAYGKAAYGWAVKRGALSVNPFVNLPVAPTVKRDRVLSDDELAAIWRATDGIGPFSGIVRLLILTGQRREEVAGMTWAELSGDFSTWIIPASRAKNGATHLVPLSAQAQDLLRNVHRFGELVLGPFNNWARAKAALDVKSGVTEWRLHDLRRTAATGLQRLGVRLRTTHSRLLNVAGFRPVYNKIKDNFFAISTEGGGLNAYSRYQAIPEGIIGFTLSWTQDDAQNAVLHGERLATLMSDLFRANIELGLPRSPPAPRLMAAAVPHVPLPATPPSPPAVKPEDKSSLGTGFFVSPEGHIVTNSHVVEGCTTVRVTFGLAPKMAWRIS
jgi:hypothetical protein